MKKFRSALLALSLGASVLLTPALPAFAEEAGTETTAEESSSAEETSAQDSEADSTGALNLAVSLDGVTLPDNSEQVSYTYHGEVVQAARTTDGLTLLPVLQDDSSVVWEVYDEDTDTAIPYHRFSNVSSDYVILPVPSDLEIPATFTDVQISIEGIVYQAWTSETASAEHMYFFYGQDGNGNRGIYRLDGANGQVIRYVEDATEAPTDDPEMVSQIAELQSQSAEASSEAASYSAAAAAASANVATLTEENSRTRMYGLLLLIGAGAAALILLVIVLVTAAKLRRVKRDLRESEQKVEELNTRPAVSYRRRPGGAEFTKAPLRGEERNAGGEGTSEVRRAVRSDKAGSERPVRRSQPAENTRPVKKAQPAEQAASGFNRPSAEARRSASGGSEVRRRTQETASGTGEVRRASGAEAAGRRPAGAKPAARPAAARPAAPEETPIRKKAAEPAEAETKEAPEAAQEPEQTAAAPEAEERQAASPSGGAVKVVKNSRVTKSMLEDLFEDDSDAADDDDDSDFEVTDFRDV